MKFSKNHRPISRGAKGNNIDISTVFDTELGGLSGADDGFEWTCCPFHPDRNPSFCINLDIGWYQCFSSACGVSGSGIVSFVSALHELDYAEARRYLEQNYE